MATASKHGILRNLYLRKHFESCLERIFLYLHHFGVIKLEIGTVHGCSSHKNDILSQRRGSLSLYSWYAWDRGQIQNMAVTGPNR